MGPRPGPNIVVPIYLPLRHLRVQRVLHLALSTYLDMNLTQLLFPEKDSPHRHNFIHFNVFLFILSVQRCISFAQLRAMPIYYAADIVCISLSMMGPLSLVGAVND